MSVVIYSGFIQINRISNNANINQGMNISNGWEYFSKTNLTAGQVAGNCNIILSGKNITSDPDILDTNMPNAGALCPSDGNIVETFS